MTTDSSPDRRFDPDWPDGTPPESYDLAHAQAFCTALRDEWAGVDPIAAALDAPAWRDAAAPVYAFARLANSFADEPGHAGHRAEALAAWEHQLERAFHGEAWHPVFVALADIVRRADVPITPLRDLLSSFRMDLTGPPPGTFETLLQHCRMAAGSLGRLVMHVAGQTDPFVLERADDLAVGLRLVGIVADLGSDIRRDRHYLPVEDFTAFGVERDDLLDPLANADAIADLIAFQLARARTWLARGRPLLRVVDPQTKTMVAMLLHHGHDRVERIERGELDPLGQLH